MAVIGWGGGSEKPQNLLSKGSMRAGTVDSYYPKFVAASVIHTLGGNRIREEGFSWVHNSGSSLS